MDEKEATRRSSSADPTLRVSRMIAWVYTQSLDSTAAFYAEMLGLECLRDSGTARIFAVGDGAAIGVCEAFADRIVEPQGGMISLVVDDVDAWYRRLDARGVEIEAPPQRLDDFGIYTFFVRGPDGYRLEFQQFLDSE